MTSTSNPASPYSHAHQPRRTTTSLPGSCHGRAGSGCGAPPTGPCPASSSATEPRSPSTIRDGSASSSTGRSRCPNEWAVDALARGDVDALADYRDKAPGAAIAHPTADHFVPLLLTVGAADDPGSAVSTIDRMVLGNSTRSVRLT